MYKQGNNEYKLKPIDLDVKHYYGIAIKKLAILQTKCLDDADVRVINKYDKDLQAFELNITQIEEACESNPDKADEIKERRKYDSIKANYEQCKADLVNDVKAQNQKELRDLLYSMAMLELIQQESFIMDVLKNILDGEITKLQYEPMFAMAVLNDFFLRAKQSNFLSTNGTGSMTSS